MSKFDHQDNGSKKIYILRHAKSDWNNDFRDDLERPLNKRGSKAALLMADFISTLKSPPGLIYCSPARRALQTIEPLVKKLHLSQDQINICDEIYYSTPDSIINLIKKTPSKINTILITGHNPILENLVSILTAAGQLNLKLPTAALAGISPAGPSWLSLDEYVNRLDLLVTPKSLRFFTNNTD